jgi:hypothetical protein
MVKVFERLQIVVEPRSAIYKYTVRPYMAPTVSLYPSQSLISVKNSVNFAHSKALTFQIYPAQGLMVTLA